MAFQDKLQNEGKVQFYKIFDKSYINILYLQVMQASNMNRMAVDALDFGVTADTPVVNFVSAIDLDQSIIRIPYLDFETSVKSIIENYLEVTSCRDKFKDKPCLKIINGLFEGDIAVDTFKISGMNINLEEICFEIVDRAALDMQGSITSTLKKVEKANSVNMIPIIISFNGKNIEMVINIKDTPLKLKNLLIATKVEFNSYAVQSIRLQYNGLFMANENSMESYNISPNSRIMAFVSKKQGCFSADTLVSCPNNIKKSICSLKKGDQILSFNVASKQLEVDVVCHSLSVSLDEYIQIKLEDGTLIETTPNHTFLCEDMQWKKVDCGQRSPQKLTKGCRLWREDASAVVVDISTKSLPKNQLFYHLSIQKNHNFLVEGIVAHNMYVNIRFSDKTEKIDINPTLPFIEVKKVLEQTYHIDRLNMRLSFAGMQIRDQQTASDKNIGKDSTLNLITKLSKRKEYDHNGELREKDVDLGYSYLHADTKILMGDNTYKVISQIEAGDEIASFDTRTRTPLANSSIVQDITEFEVKEYIEIGLEGNKKLAMSSDSFLELANGEAIHTKDLLNDYPQTARPFLQNFGGGNIKVKTISRESFKEKKTFYRLTLDNNDNFIAENVIIHRSVITLLPICTENKGNKIRYGVEGQTEIGEIKKKLCKSIKLEPAHQIYTFNSETISNQKTIMDLELRNEHVIVVSEAKAQNIFSSLIMEDNEQKAENINEKKITLQISQTEKIIIRYAVYAEKTIQEIMKELSPNYRSSYFFLFSDLMLLPEQILKEIQKNGEFKLSELTIIVVKNEKLAFVQKMSLQSSSIRSYSHILYDNPNKNAPPPPLGEPNSPALREAFQKASARITSKVKEKQLKESSFYYPFLYLTSGNWNNDLNKCVRGMEVETWERNLTKSLYVNMQTLQNYVGDCCLGMKNFKFSSFFTVEQTFYFHNFTVAHKRDKDVIPALNGKSGTLFYITSLSGKEIDRFSLYPEDQEILFSPYSYFLVEKIEKGAMDKVWIKEMPSPATFQKNIVLWVDDMPNNNRRQIDYLLSVKNIEIIQATSTIMAEKWVREFGWLLKWKGLDFKLVSDMGRLEGPNNINNPQAGLDLLDKLYVQHGITAKTLIFCGDEKRGKKLAAERAIKSKNFDITQDENVLDAFFNDYA